MKRVRDVRDALPRFHTALTAVSRPKADPDRRKASTPRPKTGTVRRTACTGSHSAVAAQKEMNQEQWGTTREPSLAKFKEFSYTAKDKENLNKMCEDIEKTFSREKILERFPKCDGSRFGRNTCGEQEGLCKHCRLRRHQSLVNRLYTNIDGDLTPVDGIYTHSFKLDIFSQLAHNISDHMGSLYSLITKEDGIYCDDKRRLAAKNQFKKIGNDIYYISDSLRLMPEDCITKHLLPWAQPPSCKSTVGQGQTVQKSGKSVKQREKVTVKPDYHKVHGVLQALGFSWRQHRER